MENKKIEQLSDTETERFIHEKVRNLCWHEWRKSTIKRDFVDTFVMECCKCHEERRVKEVSELPKNPSYTTDISAAMKAVEAMREKGHRFNIVDGIEWGVTIDGEYYTGDEKLEKAFCLAILSAVQDKGEQRWHLKKSEN